jgi:hypothetical protein
MSHYVYLRWEGNDKEKAYISSTLEDNGLVARSFRIGEGSYSLG